MTDGNAQLQWSDEQWTRVRQVVYEEARRARVAGSFLPLFGPLDPDARYAPKEVLNPPEGEIGFTMSDSETTTLSTLQVKVYLRGAQIADPDLTSALIAFRRAANVLARLEDKIVFQGRKADELANPLKGPWKWPPRSKGKLWEVVGGEPTKGLLEIADENADEIAREGARAEPTEDEADPSPGSFLVSAVSAAVGHLEERYHLGPFACVLNQKYFNIAQTPTQYSRVLPHKRITPFLGGGPLLRSSVLDLPDKTPRGIVVALGGAPIDLVVATDVSVQFLQTTVDPWYVFRVFEKIVLRVNQPDALVLLPVPGDDKAANARRK